MTATPALRPVSRSARQMSQPNGTPAKRTSVSIRASVSAQVAEPRVSIVVVAHSVKGELERCFASIERHAGVPVETILVDNASTDGTQSWVREAHPEVQLVELPENVGVAARDQGLRRAQGEFTMFLDSDA